MKERGYGRIIFTTSSSGLFGNFGQSAYSAAKMGLVGLIQTLALEGVRYGIRVNCIAPSAATQMTGALFKPEDLRVLDPGRVSAGVIALASENAPNKSILLAGAGSFKTAHITMTQGINLGNEERDGARVLAQWDRIADRTGEMVPSAGSEQYEFEAARAREAGGGRRKNRMSGRRMQRPGKRPQKRKWFQVIQFPALPTAGMPGSEHRDQERRALRHLAPPVPFFPAPGSMPPGSPQPLLSLLLGTVRS